MTEQSDVNTVKVALVGALGAIISTAVALMAVVAFYAVSARVERSRSNEAAARIQRQVEQIAGGKRISEPWLNPDLQRATQEGQLTRYTRRTMKAEDGSERTSYAVPIEQAIESVLQDAGTARPEGVNPKEAGT